MEFENRGGDLGTFGARKIGIRAASDTDFFAMSTDGDTEPPPPLFSCFPTFPHSRTCAWHPVFQNARNRGQEEEGHAAAQTGIPKGKWPWHR